MDFRIFKQGVEKLVSKKINKNVETGGSKQAKIREMFESRGTSG